MTAGTWTASRTNSTGAITARWLAASALDPDDRLVLALAQRPHTQRA